jgi:phosphoglycerate dehydrogenase-like enzyme
LLQWLADRYTVHYAPAAVQADLSLSPVAEAEVLVLRSNVRVGAPELARMTRLRLVVRAGSGTDNIDTVALAAAGVELIVVGGAASAPAVAELALQASIALLRHVPAASAALAAGRWEKNRFLGREIAGCRAAIWGGGPVGQAVAHLLTRFDCEVAFLDHPRSTGHTLPLTGLCEWAGIHILALPLRPDTRHIVDERTLAAMATTRPALVNVGRLDLVDLAAAIAALDGGQLFGLAVDPIEAEHLGYLSALLADGRDRNLQLTPHLGAMTTRTQERVANAIIDAIQIRLEVQTSSTALRGTR